MDSDGGNHPARVGWARTVPTIHARRHGAQCQAKQTPRQIARRCNRDSGGDGNPGRVGEWWAPRVPTLRGLRQAAVAGIHVARGDARAGQLWRAGDGYADHGGIDGGAAC